MSTIPRRVLPILGALAFAAVSAQARGPNIVLILADDLGYGDLGCFGCTDIPTPNLDSLARDGVRFTDAHAYNVCSPTRASLLTGRDAERVGITSVLMGGSRPEFGKATTLAKMLKDAGYATGLVGKWHLGYDGNVVPTKMGFDEFFGHLGGKIDYFQHTDSTQKGKHDLWDGDTEVHREGYSTDLFTARARQFIREHAAKPFYLQLAYNAPHYPTSKGVYQAPEAYLKKFGVTGSPDHTRGGYAAMVSCLDDGVGQVLAELKAQKLETNTLVLFLSDNGGEACASNGPLSGGKHSNKEGGIRVPWLARWPGQIPAGSVRKDVVHVMDLAPTLLAATGTKQPAGVAFDGTNVWSAFSGGASVPDRPIYFKNNCVREGRWKLFDGKLHDLDTDLQEKTDLAKAHPDIVARLTAAMPEDAKKDGGRKKKDVEP